MFFVDWQGFHIQRTPAGEGSLCIGCENCAKWVSQLCPLLPVIRAHVCISNDRCQTGAFWQELENARKKRGGDDSEVPGLCCPVLSFPGLHQAAKVNMDVIPSLNDLMQQGQDLNRLHMLHGSGRVVQQLLKEKKRKKRADARPSALLSDAWS